MSRKSHSVDSAGRDYAIPTPRERLAGAIRSEGPLPVAHEVFAWAARFLAGPAAARRIRGRSGFEFNGGHYRYLDRRHGWTWLNERCVELPIASAAIGAVDRGPILEVGNVMSHYGPVRHRVVDKYEVSPRVENIDLFDISSSDRYELVVSVSTLEHVGWDEPDRNAGVAIAAVDHLKQLVRPGGRLLITVPVGYHPGLDAGMISGEVPLNQLGALACDYRTGVWTQQAPESVAEVQYDRLLYRASAILVGEWTAPS